MLLLTLSICVSLILTSDIQASLNTVLLLAFTTVTGLLLCQATRVKLNDPSLGILGYLWLLKVLVTFFLLYISWKPEIDATVSYALEYDPLRYYFQAQELVENHWVADFVSLTYVGVLYYYGCIFYVFGHNPVIPALANTLLTLVATLFLIKVCYEIKGQVWPRDWTLSFALFLPDLLWFDALTSRETPMAAYLLLAMLGAGRYIAQTAPVSLPRTLVVVGLSVAAIAALRTSMMAPVFGSIVLMMFLIRPQTKSWGLQRLVLISCAALALVIGPILNTEAGGYEFGYGRALQTATSGGENIAVTQADVVWNERSIGMLLVPEGMLQSILFLPPRMVLYLVAPLPRVLVTFNGLVSGKWGDWQTLCTILGSLINVLAIPYAIGSLLRSVKTRRANAAPLMLHVAYWPTFVAIAGGNIILHERYRTMATLLLWGCAWHGARTCSKQLILKTSAFWYGLLTLGAVFYLIYK